VVTVLPSASSQFACLTLVKAKKFSLLRAWFKSDVLIVCVSFATTAGALQTGAVGAPLGWQITNLMISTGEVSLLSV
jgi:hypothetical protein